MKTCLNFHSRDFLHKRDLRMLAKNLIMVDIYD